MQFWNIFGIKLLFRAIDDKLGPVLPCNDGWVLQGHHCIMVNLELLSWHDAERTCSQLAGHLASVHSENFNKWVTGLFNNASRKSDANIEEDYWLGGRYNGVNWEWTDMRTWTYFNWKEGEPNNWEVR